MIEQYLLDRVCHWRTLSCFYLDEDFPLTMQYYSLRFAYLCGVFIMSTSRSSMDYRILAGVYVTGHKR